MMSVNCKDCPVFQKSIFTALSSDQIEQIKEHKSTKKYAPQEKLFWGDRKSDAIYCIRCGTVKLEFISRSTTLPPIALASAGSALGVVSVVTNKEYPMDIVA